MKKLILISLVVVGVISLGLFFKTPIASALEYYWPVQAYNDGGMATSTDKIYVAGSGTLTSTSVLTDGFSQMDIFLMVGSTTTAPTVTTRVEFSNNKVDWYRYAIASSTITSAGDSFSWVAATSSTYGVTVSGTTYVGMRIPISNIIAHYARVIVSPSVASNIYLETTKGGSNVLK